MKQPRVPPDSPENDTGKTSRAATALDGPSGSPAGDEIFEKIVARRGFSALHRCQPIAGLRSSGKGANRTILDCLFRLIGWDKVVVLPPRGVAGAGNHSLSHLASLGRFHRLQIRKGLES
jgi:hypothetical protein